MTVLFIDDERRRMEAFAMELELTIKPVVFFSEVDSAWDYFVKNQKKIKLIILDIMMPPGKMFDADSTELNLGLRTGILFYGKIRELAPKLPVIIFTNASSPEVKERFREQRKCLYIQKKGYYPTEFVQIVRQLLAEE